MGTAIKLPCPYERGYIHSVLGPPLEPAEAKRAGEWGWIPGFRLWMEAQAIGSEDFCVDVQVPGSLEGDHGVTDSFLMGSKSISD
jgi:hypothetical protein